LKSSQLAEQGHRLELVLEGTALGIWDWNPKTSDVVFDERWCRMLGYELSEIEPNVESWSSRVHPDDIENCFSDITAHMEGRTERYENVHRMQHKAGHWVYILDRGQVMERNEAGEVVRFTGTHTDVTELYRLQNDLAETVEKYDAVSDITGLGIFETNFETNRVVCNQRFRDIYGLPANPSLKLSDLIEPLHPKDSECVLAYIRDHSQNLLGGTIEYRIRVEGRTKWCRAATRYIKNEQGEVVSTVAVLDITDEKDREYELQSAVSELREERQKQAQMLSIVSHELRTPLSSAHMIFNQLDTTNLDHYLPVLRANSDSVLAIMDDLHIFIRPTEIQVREQGFDSPALIIERTLASLSELAKQQKVLIHVSFDELAAQTFLINTSALRQIITNLTKNALLHAEASNLWVNITALATDRTETLLTVCLEDDGKGISEEFQKAMFEAFSRGKTKADGTGLGLYITKQLTQSLNGEIAYFNSSKGGAGFKLTSRLANAREQVGKKDSGYSEEQLNQTLSGKAILFAEDQLTIQMLTKGNLAKAGAEVTTASNGQLALSALLDKQPDIVLTDAMMPEMDGYELSAQLRTAGYTGPIIAVTAATIGDERDRLLEAGADVVLPKPINLDELKIALADWEHNQTKL